MGDYLIAIAMSSLITGVLVWLLHPIAHRHGLLDVPKGRKDHAHPTPVTGGLAIAAAVFATLFALNEFSAMFAAFAAASMLLIVVGLLDDAYDLRWWWRMMSQVGAGLIMIYWGDVRVEYVGLIFTQEPIVLGAWGVPFTLAATVGLINAVNMSDGADGLAGSLCLVALAMLGAASLYSGNQQLFASILPIIAAVAVFLAFNMRFPWQRRAKVFLGNAGSAFLGFTIAWMAFRLTQNTAHPVSPVLAPWLLAPPLIDCLVLIVRRLKLGRSPFNADRDHAHHLLLDAGFKPTQVAVGLSVLSLVLGLAAALVLQTNVGNETHLLLGFVALTAGYYWLTSQTSRAVRTFTRLRMLLERSRPLQATDHVEPVSSGHAHGVRPGKLPFRDAAGQLRGRHVERESTPQGYEKG